MPSTPPASSIDEYIAGYPGDVQAVLTRVRESIRRIVPDATETISYAIPTFDLAGHHLVHFAAWEHHLSLYPVPRDPALAAEIESYQHGKGTLRFAFSEAIPYALIEQVVTTLAEEARR